MKALILAAGEGTRLRPLTLDRPKPMLPVNGRPLLEHTSAWLRHYGIIEIAINLHFQPQAVTDYFGDGARFGTTITYSIEDTILGTAGGAKKIAGFFDGPFIVVYGDVLTDLDLGALVRFHESRPEGSHLTMCLYRVPNPQECGIVGMNERDEIEQFVEKPVEGEIFSDLANAGIMVVDHKILEYVPDGLFYDFGRDLFPRLLERGVPMYGWPLPSASYLIDIGTPEKYEKVQREWPTRQAFQFADGKHMTGSLNRS